MRDKIIRGEVIELKEDVVTTLGPRLELHDCIVRSYADGRGVIFAGLAMNGGVFEQRVRMSDFHFGKTSFNGVRFEGEYFGCDFGDWDDVDHPRIADCDFQGALMHGCRFLNCDMARIVTPRWPSFRLNHPARARSFVMSRVWPEGVGLLLDIYTDEDPECVANISDAQILADEKKMPLSELRSILEAIPGVEIID